MYSLDIGNSDSDDDVNDLVPLPRYVLDSTSEEEEEVAVASEASAAAAAAASSGITPEIQMLINYIDATIDSMEQTDGRVIKNPIYVITTIETMPRLVHLYEMLRTYKPDLDEQFSFVKKIIQQRQRLRLRRLSRTRYEEQADKEKKEMQGWLAKIVYFWKYDVANGHFKLGFAPWRGQNPALDPDSMYLSVHCSMTKYPKHPYYSQSSDSIRLWSRLHGELLKDVNPIDDLMREGRVFSDETTQEVWVQLDEEDYKLVVKDYSEDERAELIDSGLLQRADATDPFLRRRISIFREYRDSVAGAASAAVAAVHSGESSKKRSRKHKKSKSKSKSKFTGE